MRYALLAYLLILPSGGVIYAQNTVTVQQQGSGNSASISQSNNSITETDCQDSLRFKTTGTNQISVRTKSDILFYSSNPRSNIFSDLLLFGKFNALQYGGGNNLLVLLPHNQAGKFRLISSQAGSKNYISARLNDSLHDITLSQNGSDNTIHINPCKKN